MGHAASSRAHKRSQGKVGKTAAKSARDPSASFGPNPMYHGKIAVVKQAIGPKPKMRK